MALADCHNAQRVCLRAAWVYTLSCAVIYQYAALPLPSNGVFVSPSRLSSFSQLLQHVYPVVLPRVAYALMSVIRRVGFDYMLAMGPDALKAVSREELTTLTNMLEGLVLKIGKPGTTGVDILVIVSLSHM